MQVKEFIELLENVQQQGDSYIAKCPAHEDNKSSLSIAEGDDGRVLVKCFAGCTHQDVVRSLGLQEKDLFNGTLSHVGDRKPKSGKLKPEQNPKKETKEKKVFPELPTKYGKSIITKQYEYKNADSEVIYVVLRTEAKDVTARELVFVSSKVLLARNIQFPILTHVIFVKNFTKRDLSENV